ncbi:Ig-like domain-containing protein [uncultured Bifidobacterium sp.]|uniref:Ig-like domain-containing protein n=1 Tax=uncultured Bifidobacterium sp. TaxID=165187 RepID=UPI002598F31B|nr:Ig-like domain-containing protein [uncultured Bifidobacterium sp.]
MAVTARENGQTVTVSESIAQGLQRRYKVTGLSLTDSQLAYGTVCDMASGWLAFPSNGQVNGKTGQVVTVVDCTVNGSYARAKGEAVLPAPLPPKPTGIQVTPESLTLRVGETAGLDVKVLPEGADQTVTAMVANQAIASISRKE